METLLILSFTLVSSVLALGLIFAFFNALFTTIQVLGRVIVLRVADARVAWVLGVRPGVYGMDGLRAYYVQWKLGLYLALQGDMANQSLAPYIYRLAGLKFDGPCGSSELGIQHDLLFDVSLVGANSFWAAGGRMTQVSFSALLPGRGRADDSGKLFGANWATGRRMTQVSFSPALLSGRSFSQMARKWPSTDTVCRSSEIF